MNAWRAFLWAWTLDRTADMVWTVTLAWMATQAPSAGIQGLIMAASVVPNMLAMLFGGAFADRYGSPAVAKVTTLSKAGLLMVLLVSEIAEPSLLLLALVAATIGAVDGFHDPAMDSWGGRLRTREDQGVAAATEATLWRLAQTIGAALGGVLVGIDAVVALSVAMAGMVAQRVFLHLMRQGPRRSTTGPGGGSGGGGSMVADIRQGLAFLKGCKVLWATMSAQAVVTLMIGATLSLLIPRMVREQGWPPMTFGIGSGLFAAGLMLGSAWVMRRQKSTRPLSTVGRVPFVGFVFVVAAQVPIVVIAVIPDALGPIGVCVALAVLGTLSGPVGPLFRAFRRELTPEHQQGVVAATALLLIGSTEPLGPLAAGVAAGLSSSAFALGAVALLAMTVGSGAALAAWKLQRD